MKLKYVMMETRDGSTRRKVPIIFPEIMSHWAVANAMTPPGQAARTAPCSAGFVEIGGHGVRCEGRSEGLRLRAHPDDSRIIATFHYLHGVVPEESPS